MRRVTRLGNHNWIMAYVHHRARLPDRRVHDLRQQRQLAGHVQVADYAILGGFTVVHQFCQIGAHVITAVGTIVLQSIPPS